MRQLLLIDQHKTLARKLQTSLHFEGVEVVQVKNGREVTARIHESTWDLVVIGEPEDSLNEISVLIKLRATDDDIPIIAIIHTDNVKDRVRMFHLGANDVLSYPFHVDELIVRIMNLIKLNNKHQTLGNRIDVDELHIDIMNRLVFREGIEVQLTPTEYDLLLFLSQGAGKVYSRENILYEVWGYEFQGNTNIVDVYIRYLRIKIDKGHKKKLIKTVYGVGYMISA